MDEETIKIVQYWVRKERQLWEEAIEGVRCILPDDFEDVKREVARRRLFTTAYNLGE